MKYITKIEDKEYIIEIDNDDQITINDQPFAINFEQLSDGVISLLINNQSHEAIVEEGDGNIWDVLLSGELYAVEVQDERAYRLSQARGSAGGAKGEVVIKSPMPGLILNVLVKPDQEVAKGDKVIILESMKMENELRAPRDGIIKRVSAAVGDSVEKDQALLIIGDPEMEHDEAAEVDDE
ncbi:MAG TPA: acetyl-CoA carboxylase biotin carboxyl carrier protein subunit [Anaerolineae bacterium]|nr:acetyl-CoA carboxylase biotin carboxyl carrier protein subunit [Anaerolineae bacterium]